MLLDHALLPSVLLAASAAPGSVFALMLYASIVTSEVAAPFAHKAGEEHAQAFLDEAFGDGAFTVREYLLFDKPGYYRSKPPGLASDLDGDAWYERRPDGSRWYGRRMGIIIVEKDY